MYLIAETRGEDAPVAPLFACLANEIHHVATLLGSQGAVRGGAFAGHAHHQAVR